MKKYIRLLTAISLLFISSAGLGQKQTKVGYKPPKLFTQWGPAKDTAKLSVDVVKGIVGLPLVITDAAGNRYAISSYQLAYKRLAYTEDEETGEPIPTTSMVSQLFRSTPLSPIWITQIREQLQPGEELFFFDVYVLDSKGRVLAAPNLTVRTVK